MTASPSLELHSSLLLQTSPSPPAGAAGDPTTRRPAAPRAGVGPICSIRVATVADVPCALCGTATGSGPIGYRGERPICDLCLLEESNELGMVLALVAVARAYGSVEPSSDEEQQQGLAILGAFTRIYERFAAKFGPARPILPSDKLGH